VPEARRAPARAQRRILAKIVLSTTEIGRQRDAHAVTECTEDPFPGLANRSPTVPQPGPRDTFPYLQGVGLPGRSGLAQQTFIRHLGHRSFFCKITVRGV